MMRKDDDDDTSSDQYHNDHAQGWGFDTKTAVMYNQDKALFSKWNGIMKQLILLFQVCHELMSGGAIIIVEDGLVRRIQVVRQA